VSMRPWARVAGSVRRRTVAQRARLGTHDVPINELISPLRYDILVRVEFVRLLAEYDNTGLTELTRRATGTNYETWFRRVAMARYQPAIAADDDRFADAFAHRIKTALSLWQSFQDEGFGRRHPLTLRHAGPKTRLPAGKPVRRSLYIGDGCHRLAMMVAAGMTTVPAGSYRVEPVPLTTVLDNTSVLLPLLSLTESDYAHFLAWGYAVAAPPFPGEARPEQGLDTVALTLAAIKVKHPTRLAEATAVAAADGYLARVA
jgi:hypothetical protein